MRTTHTTNGAPRHTDTPTHHQHQHHPHSHGSKQQHAPRALAHSAPGEEQRQLAQVHLEEPRALIADAVADVERLALHREARGEGALGIRPLVNPLPRGAGIQGVGVARGAEAQGQRPRRAKHLELGARGERVEEVEVPSRPVRGVPKGVAHADEEDLPLRLRGAAHHPAGEEHGVRAAVELHGLDAQPLRDHADRVEGRGPLLLKDLRPALLRLVAPPHLEGKQVIHGVVLPVVVEQPNVLLRPMAVGVGVELRQRHGREIAAINLAVHQGHLQVRR
mmetsp:Transcript_31800/g.101140  ORF Transcript_31800/g.101140 Transcript_31800/m.101140 type:complete len:278 (-) Transcript_31800:333-1166(-)